MQIAKSVPRHVTSEDIIQEFEIAMRCSVRRCSVWHGPRQLSASVAHELSPGAGLRVHVAPLPYTGPPVEAGPMPAQGTFLLQRTSRRLPGWHALDDDSVATAALQQRVEASLHTPCTFLCMGSLRSVPHRLVDDSSITVDVEHPVGPLI